MYLKTWILICEFIMAIVFIVEVILVSDKERDEDVISLLLWGEWDEETQRYYIDITDKWAIKKWLWWRRKLSFKF